MERLICIVIGYIFGLIQSGYLYGKANHMDIRQYGSGNAGSTNVLRVMGKKAGVSLGSILVSITFFAELVIFESMGSYRVSTPNRIQFYALGAILMCMAIWRHRSNIGRLLSGTENKLGAKKS